MATNKKEIEDIIMITMKPYGFKKKKNVWHLENSDCISILELDKSTWGGQFSLNLNVIVKELVGTTTNPIYGEFGGWSVDWLAKDRGKVNKYLDLEDTTINNKERDVVIKNLLEELAIPFLIDINTIAGLKNVLIKNKRLRYHTSLQLWELLKMDVEKEPHLTEHE